MKTHRKSCHITLWLPQIQAEEEEEECVPVCHRQAKKKARTKSVSQCCHLLRYIRICNELLRRVRKQLERVRMLEEENMTMTMNKQKAVRFKCS